MNNVTGTGTGGGQQYVDQGVPPAGKPDTKGVTPLSGFPEIGVEAAASSENPPSASTGAPSWLAPVYFGVLIAGTIVVASWFLIVYLRTRKPKA